MTVKSITVVIFSVLVISILLFGVKPFRQTLDAEVAIVGEPGVYKTEVKRLPDASFLVAVRTAMPNVKAEMVRWWFADYLQTTEHYRLWHPKDHVWMSWENKVPGEIIGASHLVHEYIGSELSKLRIQFVSPSEFFGYDPNDENTFAICARVGLLEEKINIAKMCHVVRDNEEGAEMRSRFWLGHVSERQGNETVRSLSGFVGNRAVTRLIVLGEQNAKDLQKHAKEEMRYLADLLPGIYKKEARQLEITKH